MQQHATSPTDTAPYHQTTSQIVGGLPHIMQSPKDNGTLEMIVIRPERETRKSLDHVLLSPEGGVHGDRWASGSWYKLPNGNPHPDVQVTLMNARMIALIAQAKEYWSLAGDNLYVDLDLSRENIQPCTQLSIGSAVVEVTAVAHNGCKKFARRYAGDAIRFINSPQGKTLRLRGVFARVVSAGRVSIGDTVAKHPDLPASLKNDAYALRRTR